MLVAQEMKVKWETLADLDKHLIIGNLYIEVQALLEVNLKLLLVLCYLEAVKIQVF